MSYDTAWNGGGWTTTGPGTINTPAIPSSLNYGNSFTATSIAGSPTGYAFYDDYIFTVSAAGANSITTTIDLGTLQVSNLQERLFNYSGNPTPTIGVPVGGVINAWTSPIGSIGTVAVLPTTILTSGTYVLQIRGNVTGAGGGSYAGTLNIESVASTVPVPAAFWMLGSGLMAVAGAARRTRRKTA
jgi:hypothetical protein